MKPLPHRPLTTRLAAAFYHQVYTRLWGMDIHPGSFIEPSARMDRTYPGGVHVGDGTYIGEAAVILTHDMTRGIYYDTRIGRNCYIAPRAIVLPGVTIGDNAVVMPGALVREDVPADCVAIGNPAKNSPRETFSSQPSPSKANS